jgi:hypothetical protein
MSMHDSANQATQGGGLGSFLAGTPSKRSSQTPKRTNTPNGRVNNPTQTESNTTRHTNTNGASSTSNFRTAPNPNRSFDEPPTDTKANGPICIATSGFALSVEDEEVSRLVILSCMSLTQLDVFFISHTPLYLYLVR